MISADSGFTSKGSHNVFIGKATGFTETTSSKLFIESYPNTPDLIGRFALGAGERNEGSNHPLLSTGGDETVLLAEINIPPHTNEYKDIQFF